MDIANGRTIFAFRRGAFFRGGGYLGLSKVINSRVAEFGNPSLIILDLASNNLTSNHRPSIIAFEYYQYILELFCHLN